MRRFVLPGCRVQVGPRVFPFLPTPLRIVEVSLSGIRVEASNVRLTTEDRGRLVALMESPKDVVLLILGPGLDSPLTLRSNLIRAAYSRSTECLVLAFQFRSAANPTWAELTTLLRRYGKAQAQKAA